MTHIHVVLTKFNVAANDDQRARPGLSTTWLDNRISLFERWTLPSVRGQSRRPDAWLILIDAETDPLRRARLERAIVGIGTLVPVRGIATDSVIAQHVDESLPLGSDVLITSRLDNDDVLAPEYCARIAGAAAGWRGFINPYSGLVYERGTVLRRWDLSSPFLSYVENRGPHPPQTVFSVEHFRAHTKSRLRQLGGPPLWLQVVHGANQANRLSGFPYSRSRAEAHLGISLPSDSTGHSAGAMPAAAVRELTSTAAWAAKRILNR